jgi:carboxymethylenebutenolidase
MDQRLSRREFLAASAAAGYALAVQPISAETIHTEASGLVAGEVLIRSGDREIPAYRARPESGQRFPLVLVVHEIFGVHEHIRDVCRRLARAGFFAVAPDLYVRQGDVSKQPDIASVLDVVRRVPDSQVMADLDATLGWAETHAAGKGTPAFVTGFCWGGRIVWLYCAHSSRVSAGAAWYGRLVGEPRPETPTHPVDLAGRLRTPVLGLYGAEDGGIPLDTVERMRAALPPEGGSEIVVYPGAPHGFHADYRGSYRPEAAQDGWKRMLAWFGEHE